MVLLTNTKDIDVINNAVLSMRIHFLAFPALGILLALRTTLQAIKTGLSYVKEHELPGAVIGVMDGDGQHLPKDMERVLPDPPSVQDHVWNTWHDDGYP